MRKILLYIIRLYRQIPQSILLIGKGSCRFVPTCSEYCYEVISSRGTIRGLLLCLGRLFKCNPLFTGKSNSVTRRRK